MFQQDHFLFYSEKISDTHVALDEEEANHAFTVLRFTAGGIIAVTDGRGSLYSCVIEECTRRTCTARIVKKFYQPVPKPAMRFFVGLPEKDAFEELLLGLVPLGVVTIIPLVCRYCQKKWWDKLWDKQQDRYLKKMIVAAKQSWNAWVPELKKPRPFSEALSFIEGCCIVADEKGSTFNTLSPGSVPDTMSCFIGPPGGFSQEELSALKQRDSILIKLSGYRLRTELAAAILAGNIIQKFVIPE